MIRHNTFSVVSWIMAEELRARNGSSRWRTGLEKERSSPTTTPNSDEEDGGDDEVIHFDGRTFYDFTSDESLPNLTIKTFLRDCIIHPKILFHKEFHFFRAYLMDVGADLGLPEDSPFSEDHEDDSFCVDKSDRKWLGKLKKRVENPNADDYWASVIPVQRKSDLGLVIFRWRPLLMSIHFLHVYLKFCESKAQPNAPGEYVDAYIRDFKERFKIQRNMDTETRLKDDIEARKLRRSKEKEKPLIIREVSVLLTSLTPRSIPQSPSPSKEMSRNGMERKVEIWAINKRKKHSTVSSSSSSTSGDDSDESYRARIRNQTEKFRTPVRRKTRRNPNNSEKIINGLSRSTTSTTTRIINKRRRYKSSTSSTPKRSHEVVKRLRKNGMVRGPNGKFTKKRRPITSSPSPRKEIKVRESEFRCKICGDKTSFESKQELYNHLALVHVPTKRNMVSCDCGMNVAKECLELHRKYCRTTLFNYKSKVV